LVEVLSRSNHTNTILRSVTCNATRKSKYCLVVYFHLGTLTTMNTMLLLSIATISMLLRPLFHETKMLILDPVVSSNIQRVSVLLMYHIF
jgi:hypothetical protein